VGKVNHFKIQDCTCPMGQIVGLGIDLQDTQCDLPGQKPQNGSLRPPCHIPQAGIFTLQPPPLRWKLLNLPGNGRRGGNDRCKEVYKNHPFMTTLSHTQKHHTYE